MTSPRSSTPCSGHLPHHDIEDFFSKLDASSRSSTPSTCSSSSYYSASESLTIEDDEPSNVDVILSSKPNIDLPPAALSSIGDMVDTIPYKKSRIFPQRLADSRLKIPLALAFVAPKSSPALPFWTPFFEAGARADNLRTIPGHAEALVARGTWRLRNIVELVQHFTWMACHARGNRSHEHLGAFAMAVYLKFADHCGEETARSFVWHLRESVMFNFRKCWRTVRHYSLASLSNL